MQSTWDSGKKVKDMDKENKLGQMDPFMRDIGRTEWLTVMGD